MESSESELPIESRKNKPNRGKRRRRKEKPPDTIITAVLKELSDDIIETPSGSIPDGTQSPMAAQSIFRNYPSDMVYIERKKGFTPAPRDKILANCDKSQIKRTEKVDETGSCIELAMSVQKSTRPIFSFFHGLFGGMAFMQCILVLSVGWTRVETEDFITMYDNFARPVQSLFYILAVICVVSVLDRCDVAQLDTLHVKQLCLFRFADILLVLIYIGTLVTTVITSYWDEQLTFHSFNATGIWEDVDDMQDNLFMWRHLNLGRCLGAICGWLLVALYPDEGLLYSRLVSIYKLKSNPEVGVKAMSPL